MTTPTRAERDEMRALLAKATPGPWHPGHHTDDSHSCNCRTIVNESYLSGLADIVVGNDRSIEDGGIDGPPADEARANALVITTLRNRAEALLDELDRAEAVNERLRERAETAEVSAREFERSLAATITRAERADEALTEAQEGLEIFGDRLQTAEATIARLTAEVTEEECIAARVAANPYARDGDGMQSALSSFLASRKGGQ